MTQATQAGAAAAQLPSRKRKASELQDDANINGNGHSSKSTKSKNSKKDSNNPRPTKVTEDIPFRLACPAKPTRSEQQDKKMNLFRARDDPEIESLSIEYTVYPGDKWHNTRTYRNVKLLEQTFTTGQIIYVNRKNPAPKPPAEDATDAEVLEWDKQNMWVGKIAQAKAESANSVLLRVFWLYWPEELPMGRQSYHGAREMIMSNAMDIIDAQAIASPAEVSHWKEDDDADDAKQKERFWRQTYDVTKMGNDKKGGLSELRRHCVCGKFYNPDHTMYKCASDGCGIFNHDECLYDDIIAKAWKWFESGTLETELNKRVIELESRVKPEPSLGERFLSPAGKIGQFVKNKLVQSVDSMVEEVKHETGVNLESTQPATDKKKPASKSQKKSTTSGAKPWAGSLEADVRITDEESGSGVVTATIKRLAGAKSSKDKKTAASINEKSWTIRLDCLKCHKPLD